MALRPIPVRPHLATKHQSFRTRAGISGVQSIPNDTDTALSFSIMSENEEGFNPGPPTPILTIATPGLWTIAAYVEWAANAAGYREIAIFDPFNVAFLSHIRGPASPTVTTFQESHAVLRKTTSSRTDIGIQVRHTAGVALNVAGQVTMLVVTRIGAR